MFKQTALALAAVASFSAVPAHAAVDIQGGSATTPLNPSQASTVTFNGLGGSPVISIPGLSAALTLTFLGSSTVSGNTVFNFIYSLTNTSTMPGGSRVSSFGFDVAPNATGRTVSGFYDASSTNVTYPIFSNTLGNGNVEVCFYNGPSGSCTNDTDGLAQGSTATGNLSLRVSGLVSNLALSDFVVRYQGFSIVEDCYQITSAIGTAVPEPATWAMMIMGFGAMGAVLRQRRTALSLA